ncbi:leucine--tRNA ligase [Patescibacteria group bacterium]|nr:leucine--tRNA ligase [Patescibacteria group bacterium]
MSIYDHRAIEQKWQKKWRTAGIYQPNLSSARKPFYNLMMFPYPSAEGLHVGNVYAFTGADVYGRFQRMQGKDVFQPIGLDGFGIHSENYSIKIGKHPAQQAKISEKRFYKQLSEIGNGFSWDQRLETYDPDYYRWTQWIFVQMFKRGLAYRKKASVNWCPSCKTVLADEQVEGGVCERCKTPTERRATEQWFFKITEYADRLLANIEKIDWPEKIKTAQRNWIGRSEGAEIDWEIVGSKRLKGRRVTTFTTRLDTIFGATFLVLSPEHPIVGDLISGSEAHNYVQRALLKTEQQRKVGEKEKTGVPTAYEVRHPLTGKCIPIWIADFVLMEYGTGAIVGVPAHDQRDFDFAIEHKLSIKQVVLCNPQNLYKKPWKAFDVNKRLTDEEKCWEINKEVREGKMAYEGYGTLVSSEDFDGLSSEEAIGKILLALEKKRLGRKRVSYHLRDWLISRQRYWGPPIPMIHCDECGWQAVPEEELPVILPNVDDWQPTGDGRSPLEKAPKSWLYTKCPECGGEAKRETDVSDTFLDSSWYFLRYPSTRSARSGQVPFDPELTKKWLPVNAYIGGAEHAVLHLLYSRFVTMALHDWEYLDFEEPFPFLFSHGLIIKDGVKMSKSRGNIVIPDDYIKKFGSDALRTYLMFLGPYDRGGDFRDTGIAGMYRFLMRVWRLYQASSDQRLDKKSKVGEKTDKRLVGPLHRTIKKVTNDLSKFRFNTAIAAMMEFLNVWEERERLSAKDAMIFLRLLAPFSPHMTEELWQKIQRKASPKSYATGQVSVKRHGYRSIHLEPWPEFDESLAAFEKVEIVVQVNGKLRGRIAIAAHEATKKAKVLALAQKQPGVVRFLADVKVRKTIWVAGKLVNFVTF